MTTATDMLRVFRPTSPMNLGTWVVASTGTFSGASALFGHSRLGNAAGWMASLSGLPMTGYTAVLLGNTAVPVWKDARRALPWLFVASAASSAGAVLEFLGSKTPRGRTMVRRFSLAGRIGEIAAAEATQRELGRGAVRKALDTGRPGRLWKASKALGWAAGVPTPEAIEKPTAAGSRPDHGLGDCDAVRAGQGRRSFRSRSSRHVHATAGPTRRSPRRRAATPADSRVAALRACGTPASD